MSQTLFEKKSGPFYDPWESLDAPQKYPLITQKLQQMIQWAEGHAPFYQNRLQGFLANTEHPLINIPVLTSDDLRMHLPPQGYQLLTQQNGNYTVFQSGGTTGVPKTSLFTHTEMELINFCNARGFYAAGLVPEDRVANLWAVGGLYMTFIHINRMLQEYGCTSFPFSNQTPADFVLSVTRLFNINCFTGITSVVLNTLRHIIKTDPALNIKKIYFGGEHIYDADRQEMKDKFGVELIKAPGYGTIDSWYLGYQCAHCDNGVFHAFDDMVYLEIIDPESGLPCAHGTTGMLHATVLVRTLTPIIRYRVGDLARWLNETCPCGRTTPLFQLLGRGDDVLRIGYDSVDYATVLKILACVPALSSRVQMEKKREAGKDKLILRVESRVTLEECEKLKQEIAALLLRERPSFSEFVKKGTVWPLEIEIMAPGALPLNPRTGKLVRVIDAL